MRIRIVTENKPYWILGRWALSWQRHLQAIEQVEECSVDNIRDLSADINFYVNYAHLKEKTKCDVGYFTHKDPINPVAFEQVAERVDWCVAQCQVTANLLPQNKISIIKPGVEKEFVKEKLVIGLAGKNQPGGRKRFEWIAELQKDFPNIEFRFANQDRNYLAMPEFYKSIDYLLVTSSIEGGPMPVLECLAMGKPMILPRGVGWCNDYPSIKFNDLQELKDILSRLEYKQNSWEISAKELLSLFQKLKNRS